MRGRAGSPCAQARACRSSKRTEPCAYPYSLTSCRVTTYSEPSAATTILSGLAMAGRAAPGREVGGRASRVARPRCVGRPGAPPAARARARPFFHRPPARPRASPTATHPAVAAAAAAAATRRAARIRPRRRWRRSDPSPLRAGAAPRARRAPPCRSRLTPRCPPAWRRGTRPRRMRGTRALGQGRGARRARSPRAAGRRPAPSGASCPRRAASAHPSLGQRGRATSARGRDCRAAGRAARTAGRASGRAQRVPSAPTARSRGTEACSPCAAAARTAARRARGSAA